MKSTATPNQTSHPVLFFSTPEAADLLRRATLQKQAADLESAIASLRTAYEAIAGGQTSYPVETFLRLPAYLQEAGHSREAWQGYKDLLAHGYPHQYAIPTLIPMDHSAIYDKMRLFLQRAGLPVPAVAYGVLAHCSWAVGLYRQERMSELHNHIAEPAIQKLVAGLLKRAGRSDIQQTVCGIVVAHLRQVACLQLHDLFTEINSLLLVQPHEYA